MVVALLGINHKTAPIEVRERFAFTSAALPAALEACKQEYGNGAIVSTCNRTELYVVGRRGQPGRSEMLRFPAAWGERRGRRDRFSSPPRREP
jgi:glutamyl-tRNA reductase